MTTVFGPWVGVNWCPTCVTWTEQTRWHSYVAPGSELNGLKVRCNECMLAVAPDAEAAVREARHAAVV